MTHNYFIPWRKRDLKKKSSAPYCIQCDVPFLSPLDEVRPSWSIEENGISESGNENYFFGCTSSAVLRAAPPSPPEKTAIYRLLMKTEEGARLARLRRANAEIIETWCCAAGSLFANSRDRERNGSRCIRVRCLPARDKLFSRSILYIRRIPVSRAKLTKNAGIVKVETLPGYSEPPRVLPLHDAREAKYKSKEKKEKKKDDIKEDFAY